MTVLDPVEVREFTCFVVTLTGSSRVVGVLVLASDPVTPKSYTGRLSRIPRNVENPLKKRRREERKSKTEEKKKKITVWCVLSGSLTSLQSLPGPLKTVCVFDQLVSTSIRVEVGDSGDSGQESRYLAGITT